MKPIALKLAAVFAGLLIFPVKGFACTPLGLGPPSELTPYIYKDHYKDAPPASPQQLAALEEYTADEQYVEVLGEYSCGSAVDLNDGRFLETNNKIVELLQAKWPRPELKILQENHRKKMEAEGVTIEETPEINPDSFPVAPDVALELTEPEGIKELRESKASPEPELVTIFTKDRDFYNALVKRAQSESSKNEAEKSEVQQRSKFDGEVRRLLLGKWGLIKGGE